MGVDTTAIIRKGVTILEITQALSKKYEGVEVIASGFDTNFMSICFIDHEDPANNKTVRRMSVSFNEREDRDYQGVWLSLGCCGNSVPIMRYLCETFGGYLDENDCDDEGYYPINYHLYTQSVEWTPLDHFKHKAIQKVGIEKLNEVLLLCEEYKQMQSLV